MKCGKCAAVLSEENECVACCLCLQKFHYDCSVRETKWRNMTVEQRSKWVCFSCKDSQVVQRKNSTTESNNSASNEEDNSTRALLLRMNGRLDTLDEVKKSVNEMSASLQYLSGKYDELLTEIQNYREENKNLAKEVGQLKMTCTKKDEELNLLRKRFNALEQYGRGVNLEIHGVEKIEGETSENVVEQTARAIGVTYTAAEIQAAHRVPARDRTKTPMFLIQFVSKATKLKWLQSGRKKRLISKDIVGRGESRVYFNENLTPYFGRLFKDTKKVAKERGYQFVWLTNGTIRVRKNEESRNTLTITDEEDLKKIV